MDLHRVLRIIQAISHLLFFQFIVLPYFYIEALLGIFLKKKPKSVKGEVVLITGTGHGIGRLLAIKYASEGATVVGWDINEEMNAQTIQQIKKSGYKAYGYKVDVSNRDEVMSTAQNVRDTVGDVTILINNAGIMPHHPFLSHTEAEIRRIMDINTMSNFWTIQAFLPAMVNNNHGHIVSLSSMAGILGLMNLVPYCASKFAVTGLMESLHDELRRTNPKNNVYFTTIYPYMVDTGLCKNYEITYPEVSPILKQEYVAEKIFEAQTLDKRNVKLPPDVGVLISLKTKFWPEKAANYFSDHFKADLLNDLERNKLTNGRK